MDEALVELYADHFRILRDRHREALAQAGYDWIVVHSGFAKELFLDDRTSPFVANPQFRAWVPLPDHQGGAVVVGADGTTRLVFFKPQDYWHAAPPSPDDRWARHYDLRVIDTAERIERELSDLSGRVALIADNSVPETLRARFALNPPALINRLHYARTEKTGYEVECMRRANGIAVRGHRAAELAFRDGASEFEIHLEYCRACGQDANDLPYDNIVALGRHGAVLHYTEREHTRGRQPSFLIDAGASFNGYAADITRTYAYDDDDFAMLIADVDELQRDICDSVTAGRNFVALHIKTHEKLGVVLGRHNLVACSPEACVANGITRTFFPHGLGHYIGTQVHDVSGHQASAEGGRLEPPAQHPHLRLTRELTAGAVCTIEPGLYFIDILLAQLQETSAARDVHWDQVERLRPYGGIRIEDDVHVTAAAPENLTRAQFDLIN